MKKTQYFYVFLLSLSLTACKEHKNPLIDFSPTDVSKWIFEHRTPDIITCSNEFMTHGQASSLSVDCKKTATSLAKDLGQAGFGNVQTDDVLLPLIWDNFENKIRKKTQNSFNPNLTKDVFK